jgi:hypothetical protein
MGWRSANAKCIASSSLYASSWAGATAAIIMHRASMT